MSYLVVNRTNLIDGFFIFIAVSGLLFNTMLGAFSALTFLVAGGWFILASRLILVPIVRRYWIVFLIPSLTVFSTFWSDIPIVTLRGAIQLLLTTLIAVVVAVKSPYEVTLRASSLACFIAMLMSFFSTRYALNGMTGEFSLIGIFGSKNYLSMNTAISLFIGLSLFITSKRVGFFSLLGAALIVLSILVLIKAKSLGAMVTVSFTLFVGILIWWYQSYFILQAVRSKINWTVFIIFVSTILFAILSLMNGTFDEAMYNLGKDPTLTGRTFIWERGIELITKKPLLGSGFQSVFYVGNPYAEEIWEFAHVPSGAGFNFHNAYIDTAVELGFMGLLAFGFLLTNLFRHIVSVFNFDLGKKHFFSVLVVVYMFAQSFLEAGWFGQFTVSQFYICLVFAYLKSNSNFKVVKFRWGR